MRDSTPLRLGTRGSALARWQADFVAGLLHPTPVELVIVRTEGDRATDVSLSVIGGQGAFTKEIQRALLDGQVDLAVHSLKDLPTEPVAGLTLAAVPARAPAADVFVSGTHRRFDDLPPGAAIATGSQRRKALIRQRRPDLTMVDIRGNVDTRLRKLEDQKLDGLILARAGLERLGLAARITEDLDVAWMIPAVGQGALGIECRADDAGTLARLRMFDHPPTHRAVLAERAFLRTLGGGCQVPIGALATGDAELHLRGVVLDPDGTERIDGAMSGRDPEQLGAALARELIAQGAQRLLT